MENNGSDGKLTNTTRITLEKRHQLIDLNKEYVNFEIFFECKALDGTKDFEMLVINQDQLDSVDLANLAMKRTRGGYISGNIVADEDKYQNYFLVIRAPEENDPMEVDLTISIRPIPPNKDKLRSVESEQQMASNPVPENSLLPAQPPKSGCPVKHIYVILALAVVGGVVVFFLMRKKMRGELNHNDPLEVGSTVSSSSSKRSSKSSSSSSSSSSQNILGELLKNKKKAT
jgi:hypothetical protein